MINHSSAATALRAHGLCKTYSDGADVRPVIEQLSFALSAGEVLALTGPSGSGKSTLLNLLAGTLVAEQGELTVLTPAGEIAPGRLDDAGRTLFRRNHVGYVFQFFNLIPTLTVRENVLLPLELTGQEGLTDRAIERLDVLGMNHRLDDFPEHLSGGERQRTAIARALAHEPALVLADEPTGNLDASNAQRVAEMLISETRALGSTLVLATHDERVARRADQILRLGT